LKECVAIEAEIKVLESGLDYCVANGLTPIIMESDSLTTMKILNGIWEVPWLISVNVRAIQKMMNNEHVEIAHAYREGNKCVDFFTNYAFTCAGTCINQF